MLLLLNFLYFPQEYFQKNTIILVSETQQITINRPLAEKGQI
jgi:hypothetical protein